MDILLCKTFCTLHVKLIPLDNNSIIHHKLQLTSLQKKKHVKLLSCKT